MGSRIQKFVSQKKVIKGLWDEIDPGLVMELGFETYPSNGRVWLANGGKQA